MFLAQKCNDWDLDFIITFLIFILRCVSGPYLNKYLYLNSGYICHYIHEAVNADFQIMYQFHNENTLMKISQGKIVCRSLDWNPWPFVSGLLARSPWLISLHQSLAINLWDLAMVKLNHYIAVTSNISQNLFVNPMFATFSLTVSRYSRTTLCFFVLWWRSCWQPRTADWCQSNVSKPRQESDTIYHSTKWSQTYS